MSTPTADAECVPAIPCSLCERIVQPDALWVTVLVSKDEQDGEHDRQQILLSHFLCYTQFLEDNGCRQFTGKVFHLSGLSSTKEQLRVLGQAQKLFEEARKKDMAKLIASIQDSNPPLKSVSQESISSAKSAAEAVNQTNKAPSSGMKRKLSNSSNNSNESDSKNPSPAKRQARGSSAFRRAFQTSTSYVSKWRSKRKWDSNGTSTKRVDHTSRLVGLPLTRSATGRRQKTVFLHTIRMYAFSTFSTNADHAIEVYSVPRWDPKRRLPGTMCLTTVHESGSSSLTNVNSPEILQSFAEV